MFDCDLISDTNNLGDLFLFGAISSLVLVMGNVNYSATVVES